MMLPILLLCFILFALCTCGFFAAWVYQDCKKRGDDPVLWAIVVFISTPFIGLLIYFLRRSEIKATCPACGHQISLKAKYCEECGTHIENKEDNGVMDKQETHHLKFIVAGIISMVLMLVCLTGFIISAATGNGVNTDVTSNDRVWNLGTISMNYDTYLN
ncbi:MAG: zinc-ribbon domain-containing protein, partial [Acutalibacteraceae bacterium]